MDRSLLVGLASLALLAAPLAARAQNGAPYCANCPTNGGVSPAGYADGGAGGQAVSHPHWQRFWTDFYRNNTWPEPFLTADRNALRTPFCIMTDNGWKMQNTVGSYLFDPETQRVNQAGELLVKWIVNQAPPHRRAVFVLQGDTPEATNARVQSVQAAISKYSGGCVYPVLLTCTEPAGWPASYIDTITQQYSATIPAPRLPARQGSQGGQGGSGSGGGGGGGVQ
jgi:hypothetical protein